MTTRITITNEDNSNGDIHVVKSSGFSAPERATLFPGQSYEAWISTGHVLTVQETWPTAKPKPVPEEAPAEAAEVPADGTAVEQPAASAS